MSQPSTQSLREALNWLRNCFDADGNLREQHQDQVSVALEKADAALESALGERQALAFGDGDYSCVECGMGMKEPCKHWVEFLVHQSTEIREPAPAAPTERLRGPLSLEMVQGAIKQATTINPLHNYVRYIDEQKLRDILNDALTAHEARAVTQARVDEARWWHTRETTPHNCEEEIKLAEKGHYRFTRDCERIADLERDLAAIASGK